MGDAAGSVARRIAIVTGGVPHYRWPFYQALLARGVELHVIAAGKLPPGILAGPSPDARVRLTHLPSPSPRWRRDVLGALRSASPDAILLEHGAALDFCWTTLLSQSISAPRILWTHGIARQELYGGQRGLASRGRWVQLRLADAIACYDRHMADEMKRRFPAKVIGVAPNSTDGSAIVATRRSLEMMGREAVRDGMGLSSRFYLAGLGRLVPDKEFSRLLRVAARVRSAGIDAGVILIGGGPDEPRLRQEATALGFRDGREVIFTGAIAAPEHLARWLYAADLCVSPGFLGLSVVDCLYAGTPVASYLPSASGPFHSPEWRYLSPDVTGFFAAEHTDNALASVCIDYLSRPATSREEVCRVCTAYASEHLGVDRMAEGMMDVIERAMSTKLRVR